MFDTLRKMIFPIIITVLLFFTATIVLDWGLGLSRRDNASQKNVAGIINGEEISWTEYNKVYSNLYQSQAGNLDEDLSDYAKRELEKQAWEKILYDHLLRQQLTKYDITVTDDEIYAYLKYTPPAYIQQIPDFQTEGQFDYKKYLNAMVNPNASPFWASVEPMARNDVLTQKLQLLVIQNAQVTEAEVKQAFLEGAERLKVGMVNVAQSTLPRPTNITDEQLRTYYEEHKEDYRVDERAALNIVMLEKKPQDYDWETARKSAQAVYDSVEAGADFAEMATYYSQDASSENGGDLGWFEKGQMVEPFDEKVFSMKEDEVSEPVKTAFGWHVIKVHGFKDEASKTAAGKNVEKVKKVHASHILFKVGASHETLERLRSKLDEFRAAAATDGFEAAASETGLTLLTTTPFARGERIQHIGSDLSAEKFAFGQDVNKISGVLENASAFFVVQVADRMPAGIADFESVKDKVRQDSELAALKTLCHDTCYTVYNAVQSGTEIKKAAKNFGFEYVVSDEFTRNSFVKEIGNSAIAIGAAFSLTQPGEISKPVDYERGSVIFQMLEHYTPDMTEYTAKHDSVSSAVLLRKQQDMYMRWFDNLIKSSEIVNNVEQLQAMEDTES